MSGGNRSRKVNRTRKIGGRSRKMSGGGGGRRTKGIGRAEGRRLTGKGKKIGHNPITTTPLNPKLLNLQRQAAARAREVARLLSNFDDPTAVQKAAVLSAM